MTMLEKLSPCHHNPRQRMNRVINSKYSVVQQSPTKAERERQKALERAESAMPQHGCSGAPPPQSHAE